MSRGLSIEDYERFARCSDYGVIILSNDSDLRVKFASKEFCNLIGVSRPVSLLDYMIDKDKEYLIEELNKENNKFSFDCHLVIRGTSFKNVKLNFILDSNKIYCLVMSNTLKDSYLSHKSFEQSRFKTLLEESDVLLLELDEYGNITYKTSGFTRLFDLKCSDLEFKTYLLSSDIVKPSSLKGVVKALKFDYSLNESFISEIEIKTVEGYKWFKVSIKGLNQNGVVTRLICRLDDIDSYKRSVHQISTKSFKDEMTGCFKKKYLLDNLSGKVLSSSCFLLFFDVDNFKGINDTFGHLNGDIVLKEIANNAFKTFDDSDSIICRFGGDEYCIFIRGITYDSVVKLIQQFRVGIRSIVIDGKRPVSISIGVSQGSNCALEVMLNEADLALYKTKERGKNGYTFYSEIGNSNSEEVVNE